MSTPGAHVISDITPHRNGRVDTALDLLNPLWTTRIYESQKKFYAMHTGIKKMPCVPVLTTWSHPCFDDADKCRQVAQKSRNAEEQFPFR